MAPTIRTPSAICRAVFPGSIAWEKRNTRCAAPTRAGYSAFEVRALVDGVDRHAEGVARAALGLDVARLGRVLLDLAAQAHHLDVDRAAVDLVIVQPREIEQLVAREDA